MRGDVFLIHSIGTMNLHTSEIYLDANATTPVLPQALAAAQRTMRDCFGNPSSTHYNGLQAKSLLQSVRDRATRVLGAGSGKVVFVSGATEAIQIAILSTLCHIRDRVLRGELTDTLLLYGATEHKVVPESLRHWNTILGLHAEVKAIPVDAQGRHDLAFLREHAHRAGLVCTMAVNNETGVISDLASIEKTLNDCSSTALWLVDGVQALGKLTLDLAHTRIDYAAFSGHKLYAPKGIGLLYAREGAPFTPLLMGGGQEFGWRSGTENMSGIAALGVVLEILENDNALFHHNDTLYAFRDQLIAALTSALPQIVFNTPLDMSVPTTLNFSVPGLSGKELLDLFDAAGIRVSSGSACSSSKTTSSHVLQAMRIPDERATSAVRLSFGPATTQDDIHAACARIQACGAALRHSWLLPAISGQKQPQNELVQLEADGACTWLLVDAISRRCIIIDPVSKLDNRVKDYVRSQALHVVAILDTHSHADHDSSRFALQSALTDQLAFDIAALDSLGWPASTESVILANGEQAQIQRIGKYVLARTMLPGHTSDSVAYLVGESDGVGRLAAERVRYAFTGDTIFPGSLGATDFATSSTIGLYTSLQKVAAIISADRTLICPAHDYHNHFVTTLAAELKSNALLSRVLDSSNLMPIADFVKEKAAVDMQLQDEGTNVLMCGAIATYGMQSDDGHIPPESLDDFLRSKEETVLIDVREPYEHSFLDWRGSKTNIANVPLTRLAGDIGNWLQEAQRPLLFFCRTGKRAEAAAKCLRRLGYAEAWYLPGSSVVAPQTNA